ncbi:hypothetical protein EV44_g3868 [Erysiphe necator]|uniref:Uncharacterized protein n=1 Tax=Uncinula necator TaxID=52586 RepID=A0A0B1NWY1_UNCNE|nr:hypothetical protein EV44_g3868 [Erysiphe necator]
MRSQVSRQVFSAQTSNRFIITFREFRREEILEEHHGLFMTGAKPEPATNWTSVIVPTVLAYIRTLQGKEEVSNTVLADEIERVSLVRPSFLKLYGQNNPTALHRT